jgi:hypothetical protein
LGAFADCLQKLKQQVSTTLGKEMKRPSAGDAKNAPEGHEVNATLPSSSPLFNTDKPDMDDGPIEDDSQAATEAVTEATTFTSDADGVHLQSNPSSRQQLDKCN